jgi:hypothetical protein
MTTKMHETTNLSESLARAAADAEAAAKLEAEAAAARARAHAAAAEAQARQEAAQKAWAEGALATEAEQRDETRRALSDARAALDVASSNGDLPTIVDAWRAVWRAMAAVHGLDVLHERAHQILGLPSRPPKDHRPDFASDLARGMNVWAFAEMQAAREAVNESLMVATTGRKDASDAK